MLFLRHTFIKKYLVMKKILLQVSIIISLFTISSCTKAQNKELQSNEEVIFNTGYYVKPWHRGNFYDKDSNLFFYFSEPVSHKEIQIFNRKQQLVKKISLKHIDYIYAARSIQMPSMDSIIISIGQPLQTIFVLDSNANIIYQRYFSFFFVEEGTKYAYEISTTPFQIYKNGYMYIYQNTTGRNVEDDGFVTDEGYIELLKHNYRRKHFVKFKLDSIVPEQIKFGNYYNQIYNYETSYKGFHPDYKVENNKLFHFCTYTNKVAITDCDNLDSVKIITINSKYTPIGLKERKITNGIDRNKVPERMRKDENFVSGKICNVAWDNYREVYYFFIRSKYKEKWVCDYIIQVFDKDFNFIKEIKLDDYDYISNNGIVVIKEGILLNETKEENEKKIFYRLCTIDF